MMQVYYQRADWITGLALFAGFWLTFYPSRPRLFVAAGLWTIGALASYGIRSYDLFLRGGIAYAFSSPSVGFPLFAWLIPVTSLLALGAASALLLPTIEQKKALKLGKIVLLLVWPILILLTTLPQWFDSSIPPIGVRWPLGIGWIGYPLLWFRIREQYGPAS